MTPILLAILLLVLLVVLPVRARVQRLTVFEYERALLYVGGRFHGLLGPGQYWIWAPTRTATKVDLRERIANVSGQEVLSADGIAVKLTIVAQYRVTDPVAAVNAQLNFDSALHTELQLAIRRLVSAEAIDSLLAKRPQFAAQLTEAVRPEAARLGLELLQADVRDLTLPGELKKLFTQVTKARQEGLAALERARGETAALRNLANAAKLVQDNPALMQLRLLQVLGEQSGNTVVIGAAGGGAPLPIAGAARAADVAPRATPPDA